MKAFNDGDLREHRVEIDMQMFPNQAKKSKSPGRRKKKEEKTSHKSADENDVGLKSFAMMPISNRGRFVFPDGTSFVPDTNQQLISAYNDGENERDLEELPDLSQFQFDGDVRGDGKIDHLSYFIYCKG